MMDAPRLALARGTDAAIHLVVAASTFVLLYAGYRWTEATTATDW